MPMTTTMMMATPMGGGGGVGGLGGGFWPLWVWGGGGGLGGVGGGQLCALFFSVFLRALGAELPYTFVLLFVAMAGAVAAWPSHLPRASGCRTFPRQMGAGVGGAFYAGCARPSHWN